jgi:hypothetical protein
MPSEKHVIAQLTHDADEHQYDHGHHDLERQRRRRAVRLSEDVFTAAVSVRIFVVVVTMTMRIIEKAATVCGPANGAAMRKARRFTEAAIPFETAVGHGIGLVLHCRSPV